MEQSEVTQICGGHRKAFVIFHLEGGRRDADEDSLTIFLVKRETVLAAGSQCSCPQRGDSTNQRMGSCEQITSVRNRQRNIEIATREHLVTGAISMEKSNQLEFGSCSEEVKRCWIEVGSVMPEGLGHAAAVIQPQIPAENVDGVAGVADLDHR